LKTSKKSRRLDISVDLTKPRHAHATIALAQRLRLRHTGRVKSLTEQLWFEVPGRRGFVNITGTVAALVRKSGVQEGLCLVNTMHITASVFINDAEDGLLHDYEVWLKNSRRTRPPANTITTAPARTTPTRT
jgi:hypothetical protein